MKDNQMKQAELIEDASRKEFEAEFSQYKLDKFHPDGYPEQWEYKYKYVRHAWDGWQARAKLTTSQVSEPVIVEAVAEIVLDGEGLKAINWLVEGSESAFEVGDILIASHTNLINDDGIGEVYLAPTTPQEAISPAIAQAMKDAGRYKCLVSMATKDFERAAQYQFVGKLHEFVDDIKPSVDEALASKPTGLE